MLVAACGFCVQRKLGKPFSQFANELCFFLLLYAGFMYDSLKTFKPVFYLAAGPMIFGAFLLVSGVLCKQNQSSLGREDMTNLVPVPSPQPFTGGANSSNHQHPTFRSPVIVLTELKEIQPLIVVERLTVL